MMRGMKMYTDTLFAQMKLIRGDLCAQNWTDGLGCSLFYPLKLKSEAWMMVSKMVHQMQGIPEVMHCDGWHKGRDQ
jgi:hypothetical protein